MEIVDGRKPDEIRPLKVEIGVLKYPPGSCLISMGDTKVLCAASVEEGVPQFLKGTGQGWITAEYSMLPGSTHSRKLREGQGGRYQGRTYEIQRLIGRSLRAAVNLEVLGERTIWVDCDVIQADGGTRTAAINGGFIALSKALEKMMEAGMIDENPVKSPVAAVSVGVVEGVSLLDLSYVEDLNAEVDMNVVMNARGEYIEIQGTSEKEPFDDVKLKELLELSKKGIRQIMNILLQAISLK